MLVCRSPNATLRMWLPRSQDQVRNFSKSTQYSNILKSYVAKSTLEDVVHLKINSATDS